MADKIGKVMGALSDFIDAKIDASKPESDYTDSVDAGYAGGRLTDALCDVIENGPNSINARLGRLEVQMKQRRRELDEEFARLAALNDQVEALIKRRNRL